MQTCTSFGDISFAVVRQRLWSGLLAYLQQMITYGQFRQHLKAHLFRVYKLPEYRDIDFLSCKYTYLLIYYFTACHIMQCVSMLSGGPIKV